MRWHLREKPEVRGGLLRVFLRAVATTIRQRSPDAPSGARFGAVAFVHRFGSYLNSHVHFHILVTDGVFSSEGNDGATFHPAVDLTDEDIAAVERNMRHRGLRWLHRHGHLDSAAVHTLNAPDHAGVQTKSASLSLVGCLVACKLFFRAERGLRSVASLDIVVFAVVGVIYYEAQRSCGYHAATVYDNTNPVKTNYYPSHLTISTGITGGGWGVWS